MIPSPVCLTSRPSSAARASRTIVLWTPSRAKPASSPKASFVEPTISVKRMVRIAESRSLSAPGARTAPDGLVSPPPTNASTSSGSASIILSATWPCASRCTNCAASGLGASTRQKALPWLSLNQYLRYLTPYFPCSLRSAVCASSTCTVVVPWRLWTSIYSGMSASEKTGCPCCRGVLQPTTRALFAGSSAHAAVAGTFQPQSILTTAGDWTALGAAVTDKKSRNSLNYRSASNRPARISASGQLRRADEGGLDRSRGPDQFGYSAAMVCHPDVARAVDRHAKWAVKVRPGGGKVTQQAPGVVQSGYGAAFYVRHPDVARAVDRHEPWGTKVRPGGGKVAEQGPGVVQGGYAAAFYVRHPDVARAVDRHAKWLAEVRPGGGKVARQAPGVVQGGYGIGS